MTSMTHDLNVETYWNNNILIIYTYICWEADGSILSLHIYDLARARRWSQSKFKKREKKVCGWANADLVWRLNLNSLKSTLKMSESEIKPLLLISLQRDNIFSYTVHHPPLLTKVVAILFAQPPTFHPAQSLIFLAESVTPHASRRTFSDCQYIFLKEQAFFSMNLRLGLCNLILHTSLKCLRGMLPLMSDWLYPSAHKASACIFTIPLWMDTSTDGKCHRLSY